jgi:hypothetical protein
VNGRWIDQVAPYRQHIAMGAMYYGPSTIADTLCGQRSLLVFEENLLSPEITPERACKTCVKVRDQ